MQSLSSLAFANNDLNHYKYTGIECAEQEGALFIFECLKILLGSTNKKGQHLINFKGYEKLPPLEETRGKLKEYLTSIARPDQKEQLKILVHIDKHRKMCQPEKMDSALWLSKRAMLSKDGVPCHNPLRVGSGHIPRMASIPTQSIIASLSPSIAITSPCFG